MPTSRDLPIDRLAIGQLLVRLLAQFRTELFAPAAAGGYADIRPAHLQVFGNVGITGIRLTQLASLSQLSLSATSELVDDLQRLDYLERRADPADGRAKLIFPTARGRSALNDAGDRVAEIEEHWAQLIGHDEFHTACQSLQHILNAVTAGAESTSGR
jgi:DNA-binding MarR family transcriptional regulator